MALFSNKEYEILLAENTGLKDKISTLEVRLATKDKALSECKRVIDRLDAEIEECRAKLSDSFPSHKVKQAYQYYEKYISDLLEELDALQTRPHNERGVGRRHKATSEQKEYILSLSSQGISQNRIARIMSEQTCDKWNKTTIRNIVISAKN